MENSPDKSERLKQPEYYWGHAPIGTDDWKYYWDEIRVDKEEYDEGRALLEQAK